MWNWGQSPFPHAKVSDNSKTYYVEKGRGQSPIPHSKKKQNMKKTYIKPSTEEIKIQAPQVLVGSEEIPLEWGDLLG